MEEKYLFNLLPKDIKKQVLIYFPTRVVLTYQVETSDHEYYCSGGECEYDSEVLYKEYDVKKLSKRFRGFAIGAEITDEDDLEVIAKSLGAHRKIERGVESRMGGGSMYCGLSEECVEHDLDIHEYRITYISAEYS